MERIPMKRIPFEAHCWDLETGEKNKIPENFSKLFEQYKFLKLKPFNSLEEFMKSQYYEVLIIAAKNDFAYCLFKRISTGFYRYSKEDTNESMFILESADLLIGLCLIKLIFDHGMKIVCEECCVLKVNENLKYMKSINVRIVSTELTTKQIMRKLKKIENKYIKDCISNCCENCRLFGKEFKRCSRCKSVNYCSEKCQKENWKKHKLFCKL